MPSPAQHASVGGGGHAVVAHAVPAPCSVPPELLHCTGVAFWHVPLGAQHAWFMPQFIVFGWHWFITQVVFGPQTTPPQPRTHAPLMHCWPMTHF